MAALSADSTTRRARADHLKIVEHWALGTSAAAYVGSLMMVNQTTQRAIVAAVGAITNRRFLGVAETSGTGNTAGTVYCRIAYNHQVLVNMNTTHLGIHLGGPVCVKTDNDVAMPTNAGTTGNRTYVGHIAQFGEGDQAGDVWVWLRHNAMTS